MDRVTAPSPPRAEPSAPWPSDVRVPSAMERALEQAERAAAEGEIPVGAVLVDATGRVLAAEHNRCEALHDPTAHAELLVLRRACSTGGRVRLPADTLLVVTLEPCAMCAGALVWARVGALAFAAPDPKAGACGSLRDVPADPRLNHRVRRVAAPGAERSAALLRGFFAARR